MLGKLLLGALALALLAYLGLALYSRKAPVLGLVDGRLRECASPSNCVNSEGPAANVAPLAAASAWPHLAAAVRAGGGQIRVSEPDYLHATYQSRYMRFVDDLEARRDAVADLIHVRSASRVGVRDRGVNRARVAALCAALRACDGPLPGSN